LIEKDRYKEEKHARKREFGKEGKKKHLQVSVLARSPATTLSPPLPLRATLTIVDYN
jgi:hypothetical protein